MTKIYFIPGLGCDARVFERLIQQLDLSSNQYHCLEHIEPQHTFEPLSAYAKRLAQQLEDDKERIIVGLSLGGMIATELSKIVDYKKLVIISSIKHQDERPLLLKVARKIPLHHLAPAWFTKQMSPRIARWFRISDKASSDLLAKMLKDRSGAHLKWARHAAVSWKNAEMPQDYIHIHGTKDHIFNSPKTQITHIIEGGTHGMIMNRATEIAAIIDKEVL